jgi:hypothetical protein
MLKMKTHFEQVPLDVVKKITEEQSRARKKLEAEAAASKSPASEREP